MMIHNQSKNFTGGAKNAAVLDILKADNLKGRLTLGLRVIRAVYLADGFIGFYRGFLSSLIMYIPSSMVFWAVYYETLLRLKKEQASRLTHGKSNDFSALPQSEQNLLFLQAISGASGGMAAAVVTNPLEVMRIRIQVIYNPLIQCLFQVHRTSYWETLRRMIKFERTRVFYKGLAPRLINNGVYSCLIMIGYETVKRFSVLPEHKDKIVW
jgi:solute carrier family 25 protein 44